MSRQSRESAAEDRGDGEPTASVDARTLPVSVVMPAHNRAEIIGRALGSIAAQRPWAPAEVVVVDDGSTDDTAAVAERWGAKVVRLGHNQGAAAARNAGFEAATQPWVALLDSDDEWLPHCLEVLWGLRNGHVLVSGANLGIGDTRSGPHRYGGPVGREPWVLRSPAALIYPLNFIVNSATLIRRDVVLSLGGYNTQLRYSEDFDLWLRVLEHGTGISTGRVVTRYYHHAGQKTKNVVPLLDAQQEIASSYAGRPWWAPRLAESRMVVRRWDEIRLGREAGGTIAHAKRALWLASRPHRLRALVGIWVWRFLVRRRSWRLGGDGEPVAVILPGSAEHERRARRVLSGRCVREMGSRGRARALAHLARRPAGLALAEHRVDVLLLRIVGCPAELLLPDRLSGDEASSSR